MRKTYYRIRQTQLGTDGGMYRFFRTKEDAEKYCYEHVAEGGGAGNVRAVSYDTETQYEDIEMIEEIISIGEITNEGRN